MDRVAGFTPEQARLLWQDYQSRQQLNPQIAQNFPVRREVSDVSPHRVFVKNTEAETIPPYACMRITGVDLVGSRTVVKVEKPTDTEGEFLFNCQYPIEAPGAESSGVGWAYRYGVVVMLGDEPSDPNVEYQPIIDSWEIEEGGGPFVVFGRHDANDRALIGRFVGSGGGARIMHFRIREIDCYTGDWYVEPTFVSDCASLPDERDDGLVKVRPSCCESPYTTDELIASGYGTASYVYHVDTCGTNGQWREIVHCADDGCGSGAHAECTQ